MRIKDIRIRNFKSIREIHIPDIEQALILVGQNSTGKTAILDALRTAGGIYQVQPEDFREDFPNIEIMLTLSVEEEDLKRLHQCGIVSSYRRYESWYRDFCRKIPSFHDGEVTFECTVNKDGKVRYGDGFTKNNRHIPMLFPKIYYIDAQRDLENFEEDLWMMQEDDLVKRMRSGSWEQSTSMPLKNTKKFRNVIRS